jgi:hypothetical protein
MPFWMQFHAENGCNPDRKEVCTMNTHDVVQRGSAHQDEQELRQHMQEQDVHAARIAEAVVRRQMYCSYMLRLLVLVSYLARAEQRTSQC